MPKANPPDLDALRRDIAAERARLADAVAALAYRANVPARIKEDVADRIAAAKRSAFGGASLEPGAAEALLGGDAGDDAAMLAVESAADVLEAIDVRANGVPRSAARFVARYRLLFAIGAFVLIALSIAVKRGKTEGHDAAA